MLYLHYSFELYFLSVVHVTNNTSSLSILPGYTYLPDPRAMDIATNREASTAVTSTTSQSSSSSPNSLQSEEKNQQKEKADFAELIQMRHHCISLCRESLSWLGHTADALEAECADLCERASGLPKRMEKRLSAVC